MKLNRTGAWAAPKHKRRRNAKLAEWIERTDPDVDELSVSFEAILDEIQDSLAAGAPTKGWMSVVYEVAGEAAKGKLPFGAHRIGFDRVEFAHDLLVKEPFIYEDYSVGLPKDVREVVFKIRQVFHKRTAITVNQHIRQIYGWSLREIMNDKVLSMEGIEEWIEDRMMNNWSYRGLSLC